MIRPFHGEANKLMVIQSTKTLLTTASCAFIQCSRNSIAHELNVPASNSAESAVINSHCNQVTSDFRVCTELLPYLSLSLGVDLQYFVLPGRSSADSCETGMKAQQDFPANDGDEDTF